MNVVFEDEEDQLLEKYNTIWHKVSADIEKKFNNEAICSKRFLKTKVKFYGDEAADFHDKKIATVDSNHTCLAVISMDSALNKDGNYYPEVILKECKCIES